MRAGIASLAAFLALSGTALAGPPYVTDDPQPTDFGHWEVYAFTGGTQARDGQDGAGGLDLNYGAAPDLQLTMVVPLAYDRPAGGGTAIDLGNIELAVKYKFLHQDDFGVDVAFFPRVFLPSGSPRVGERHASLLLPLWVGRSWDDWSTFGGGGCVINNGGGSHNFCQIGWVLTNQVKPNLNLGAEIYHQTADAAGGKASTGIGAGAIYDLSERYHLLASFGPGIQNAAETGRYSWYAALEITL